MRRESVIDTAIRRGRTPTPQRVEAVVSVDRATLGARGFAGERDRLAAEVLGLGPLEPVVADPRVTDVLVNGDGSVWVDAGAGVEESGVRLEDAAAARRLAVRLAALAGRRLDESQPWVDGLLAGGVRLHAILPPLVEGGAHLSLRVPRARADGLASLQATGMFDPEVAEVLRALVRARRSFVVSGGTGCGKTTLLAALLAEVPHSERLVVVEDVRELAVQHPHVVRLQGRSPNVEGHGAVGLVDLVRQALRMRPDRLVVGEVRGAEVREMLAALNTGHEGGCGTVHANSPGDVPTRFEALGALAGMSRGAVRAQLTSAVQVVVHVGRRGRDGGAWPSQTGADGAGAGEVRADGFGAGARRVETISLLAGHRGVELALDAATGRRGPAWARFAELAGFRG